MESNGMGFEPLSEAEKRERADKLIGLADVNQVSLLKTTFYK